MSHKELPGIGIGIGAAQFLVIVYVN